MVSNTRYNIGWIKEDEEYMIYLYILLVFVDKSKQRAYTNISKLLN